MEILNFFGRMQKGKSTAAYHFAKRQNSGIVIFDPRSQYRHPDWRVVHSKTEFELVLEQDLSPIVFRPGLSVEEDFEDFAEVVWDMHMVSAIIDEAERLQSPQWIHEHLDQLVRSSESQEISLYLTQHQLVDVNGIIVSLCSDLIFFEEKNVLALERIERYTSAAVRERVSTLEGRDFLRWSVPGQDFVVVQDSDSWYESIGEGSGDRRTKLVEESNA